MASSIIAIGWLVFWLYWIIEAVRTTRKNPYKSRGTTGWYLVFVMVAAVVSVWLRHTKSVHLNLSSYAVTNTLLQAIGSVIFILGLGLAIWARVYLGGSWGMPVAQRQKNRLITNGPYKYIRHPIYSGLLFAILGTALVINLVWLVGLIAACAYLLYCSVKEEELLTKQFPQDYPRYKAGSKMLIPFVL